MGSTQCVPRRTGTSAFGEPGRGRIPNCMGHGPHTSPVAFDHLQPLNNVMKANDGPAKDSHQSFSYKSREDKTTGDFSDVTVTRHTKSTDSHVTTSLSLSCEGRTGGKTWLFQLGDVDVSMSAEELEEVVESIRGAVVATLPPLDAHLHPTPHTCPAHHRKSMDESSLSLGPSLDDTVMSVVSVDSGLPSEPDTAYRVACPRTTWKQHAQPQVVSLAIVEEDARHKSRPSQPSPSSQSSSSEASRDLSPVVETVLSSATTPPPQPQPEELSRQQESSQRKRRTCSKCRHRRQETSKRKRDGERSAVATADGLLPDKRSFTLTSVNQDTVEDYLTYKFRNAPASSTAAAEQRSDTKSLTFSEYMHTSPQVSPEGRGPEAWMAT